MTNGGLSTAYDVEDLDSYYERCVIGGPGAFMIPVNEWSQFPEAIRRKLVLELVSNDAVPEDETFARGRLPVILAQAATDYDCMIGEKLWRNRSWMWEDR